MSGSQRATLVASVLASSITFFDSTAVNVALPAIADDLGGGLSTQQWVVSAYALTLGALILVGGTLGDVLGERRIFLAGLAGFAITSLACAVAPSAAALVLARAAQGVAGALLTPAALALIVGAFPRGERGAAIGSWTAWSGIAIIAGPVAGGQLVALAGWESIFLVNLPLVAVTFALVARAVPERRPAMSRTVDVPGAALAALGLGAPVLALIEQPQRGWGSALVVVSLVVGAVALVGFAYREATARDPMLPPGLLRRRTFLVANAETVGVYGVLGVLLFSLTLFLQEVGGWTPAEAGLASLPTTIVTFLLARRFGMLADRHGPRLFMAAGPALSAGGLLLMLRVQSDVDFAGALLPALALFSIGLSMTVAPLTATVLADVGDEQAGIASAVNNAVARLAGLAGVAALGPLLGGAIDEPGFHLAMGLSAAVLAASGAAGAVFLRDPRSPVTAAGCAGGALVGAPRDVAPGAPRLRQGQDQSSPGREASKSTQPSVAR